jgi:hypothetical protein
MEALSAGTDRILRPVAALPENPNEPRYEIFHDRLSSAVLDWRSRYLKEKEVTEAKREDLVRRRTTIVDTEPEARPAGESRVGPQPPRIIAELLRGQPSRRGMPSESPMVVVLGAGVSASYRETARWHPGAPFPPTGWELSQLLAEEAAFPIDDLRATSLAEVASYYTLLIGSQHLYERLRDIFTSAVAPTQTHRLFADIAASGPLTILTSTFDTLTEQAFDERQVPYHVVINMLRKSKSPEVLWRKPDGQIERVRPKDLSINPAEACIYKVFGSVVPCNRELDSFIVSEEDEMELFALFSMGHLPPPRIQEALYRTPVLFLGMSLRSWTQRLLVNQVRRRDNLERLQGWAIVRGVSAVDRRRWELADVKVFDMDVGEFCTNLEAQIEGRT